MDDYKQVKTNVDEVIQTNTILIMLITLGRKTCVVNKLYNAVYVASRDVMKTHDHRVRKRNCGDSRAAAHCYA